MRTLLAGHQSARMTVEAPSIDLVVAEAAPSTALDNGRLRRVISLEYGFVWRSLRRLGVPEADADDGAQRVFAVLVRRLGGVLPGRERSFLFQTALRVASDIRRAHQRSRLSSNDAATDRAIDERPRPDEALEQQQARELLAEALDGLAIDLRTVFVLFELEELSTADIAEVLDLPQGTVSSRLRRAREEFRTIAARLQTKDATRRKR